MSTNISVASYLNQIFYPHNKFDDALETLEPWMMTFDKLQDKIQSFFQKTI
jgi:hypothetical protein